MNTALLQDNVATEATDFGSLDIRLLAEFEVAQVGGGEAVAVFL